MNRDFKGIWIPKHIWLAEDLTDTEKFVIAEVDSLDQGDGCWATNKHLSDVTRRAQGTIENVVCGLVKRGILISKVEKESNRRMLSVSPLTHATVGEDWECPRRRGLPIYNSREQLLQNTTTFQKVESGIETEPVVEKKVNWDDCKSDLQRFMAFYVKNWNETLYKDGSKEQVTAFFRTYGKMFSNMLAIAGGLETACNTVVYFDRHFKKEGWSWNLRTLTTNFPEFVNYAMQKKKEEHKQLLNCWDNWVVWQRITYEMPNTDTRANPYGMPYKEVAKFVLCCRRYSNWATPSCVTCKKETTSWANFIKGDRHFSGLVGGFDKFIDKKLNSKCSLFIIKNEDIVVVNKQEQKDEEVLPI